MSASNMALIYKTLDVVVEVLNLLIAGGCRSSGYCVTGEGVRSPIRCRLPKVLLGSKPFYDHYHRRVCPIKIPQWACYVKIGTGRSGGDMRSLGGTQPGMVALRECLTMATHYALSF